MRKILYMLAIVLMALGCSTQKNEQPPAEAATNTATPEAATNTATPEAATNTATPEAATNTATPEAATNTATPEAATDDAKADAAKALPGAKAAVPGESPSVQQAIELPFQITLNSMRQGDETHVTITVDYKTALSGTPVLRLTPKGDTEIIGSRREQQLAQPTEAGTITKTIRLKGTDPGIKVSVSLMDNGFGVEVHDEWPPKKVTHQAPKDIMEPLPAPIVVDGMEIDRGVRVRPE